MNRVEPEVDDAIEGAAPAPDRVGAWRRWTPWALLGRLLVFVWRQWEILNQEAAEERAAAGYADSRRVDPRVLAILATAAVSLVLQEYFGDRATFDRIVDWVMHVPHGRVGLVARAATWMQGFRWGPYYELGSLLYWATGRMVGYIVVPIVAIAFLPGVRLRDCGLRLRGAHRHLWIYLVLYLGVLPLVVLVSYQPGFLQTYPFYKNVSRSGFELLTWELFYFGQFFALEFFFRGVLLHPLKRALGAYAIFVMAVPYCMIHFGKPLPETFGAIVAGIVLGTLSLRTRSIYAGVLIHISVALSMDLLAMSHTLGFPHHFWPYLGGRL